MKIQEEILHLPQYNFNKGVVSAFSNAVEAYSKGLRKVILDRNNLDDSLQAEIITALQKRRDVQEFTTVNNSFGRQSLKALIPWLQDENSSLEELNITNSNPDASAVTGLLETLVPKPLSLDLSSIVDGQS